jgi:hypothetical protein
MRPSRSGWSGHRRRQAAQSGRGKGLGLALSCNRARNSLPVLSACGPNSQTCQLHVQTAAAVIVACGHIVGVWKCGGKNQLDRDNFANVESIDSPGEADGQGLWEERIGRALAVGLAAMEDGVEAESVGMLFGEAHAVFADAQARFAGLSLQFLHIAFAGLGEAVQRGEDAHTGLAIDTANVSLSGDGKDNFLHASIGTA